MFLVAAVGMADVLVARKGSPVLLPVSLGQEETNKTNSATYVAKWETLGERSAPPRPASSKSRLGCQGRLGRGRGAFLLYPHGALPLGAVVVVVAVAAVAAGTTYLRRGRLTARS